MCKVKILAAALFLSPLFAWGAGNQSEDDFDYVDGELEIDMGSDDEKESKNGPSEDEGGDEKMTEDGGIEPGWRSSHIIHEDEISPFATLSDPILKKIFQYLPLSGRIQLAEVCRAFRDLLQDESLLGRGWFTTIPERIGGLIFPRPCRPS